MIRIKFGSGSDWDNSDPVKFGLPEPNLTRLPGLIKIKMHINMVSRYGLRGGNEKKTTTKTTKDLQQPYCQLLLGGNAAVSGSFY